MLAPIIRTIQRFPVHTDLLDGTVISIENANLSLKWESSSRKLRDTTGFFLLLEFDRRVESFEEQPVTIAYCGLEGRVCHYTPDVLVRYRTALAGEPDWRPVLYEVKYRNDLREHGVEYRPKFKAAKGYARDRGWRFRVVTEREIRTSRLSNIRFLLRYRRMRVDDQDRDALLATLRQQGPLKPPTLLALTYPDSCRYAETLAALWHLVAIGQIGVDLDQLLTPHSVLRLGTAGVDQDSRHLITPVLEPSREKGDDHR